ncbi:MAG TPA: PIG-L family deacetylase [Bryobacteraceae bacterium]|nr:PIG-L family deacetylase [Bryobacteraceae bacterium]
MLRRNFCTQAIAAAAMGRLARAQQQAPAPAAGPIVLERSLPGQPHRGKVLLAVQAHSDDIPLFASGTVAKLIEEGYTGYLIRATNDDMGDAVGLGTPGTIGENVLGNERDTAEVAKVLGCQGHFDLNYNNHRMADVSVNEVIGRLIFLIRLLKADTVVGWDPWGHDEENPDHYTIAKALEAACWMAGRAHDYPEQFAAGLQPKTVEDKYYFARRPEITRVVDITGQIDKKIDAIRANVAKGPGGHSGSRLRAELAKNHQRLPLLGDDDVTADRNYIREFSLTHNRDLGKQYGVEYAEVFHYIPAGASGADRDPRVDEYVKQHAVPGK